MRCRMVMLVWLLSVCAMTVAARPKVGLVLGGGGAKGAATIGVLKVIEEAGVKVDYIAGTSIGAVIGGLYAAGVNPSHLEQLFLSQEWRTILSSRGMQRQFEELLSQHGCRRFCETRIPFRCVAVDYDTMKEVVLSGGSLPRAMLASMSIPIVYEPVSWNGRRLVDGGLINNLPVDVVRAMGADIVIAVDLQQGRDVEFGFSLRDLIGLGGLADWFFRRPDISRYRTNKDDVDIYIHPDLRGYNVASFERYRCEIMMQRGYDEAKELWNELIRLL